MQPPVRVVINMMHTCTSHRFRPMKNLATLPFFPLLIGFRTASGPTKQGSLIIPLHRLALISRIDTCGLTSKAGCRRSRLLPLVATSGWISLCTLTPTRGRRTSQRRNLFLLPPAANNGVGASQRFCHGQRPPRLLQERITLTHHSIRRSLLLLCPLARPTAEELFGFQLQSVSALPSGASDEFSTISPSVALLLAPITVAIKGPLCRHVSPVSVPRWASRPLCRWFGWAILHLLDALDDLCLHGVDRGCWPTARISYRAALTVVSFRRHSLPLHPVGACARASQSLQRQSRYP
mmetsp:Transcript_50551/g.126722  ORF Transcript_50551/g.126722 Transcript_50551/m.126722 type:complete len:294 (-) Transcript_50551:257-1138(-)